MEISCFFLLLSPLIPSVWHLENGGRQSMHISRHSHVFNWEGGPYWRHVDKYVVKGDLVRGTVHVFWATNANKVGNVTVSYADRDEGIITCSSDRATRPANRDLLHLISWMIGRDETHNYEIISLNIFHSILISRTFIPQKWFTSVIVF